MERFERILYIHGKLARNSFPTQGRLASDLEVTERTIRRDLDYMKHLLHAPLAYDPQRRGYCYSEPAFALPATVLSYSQLAGFLFARLALERDRQAPWYAGAKAAFDRVLESIPETEVRRQDGLLSQVAFLPSPAWEMAQSVWQTLTLCIECQESVRLRLKSEAGGAGAYRIFDPYQLIVQADKVLVCGWDHQAAACAQVALSEIEEVEFTDKAFQKKKAS